MTFWLFWGRDTSWDHLWAIADFSIKRKLLRWDDNGSHFFLTWVAQLMRWESNKEFHFFAGVSFNHSEKSQMAIKQALISAYEHNIRNKLKEDLKGIDGQSQEIVDDKKIGTWSTTWWQQFSVLLRGGVKVSRHDIFSFFNIIQVLFAAFITGLLWWQSDVSHLQDQVQNPNFYSLYCREIVTTRARVTIIQGRYPYLLPWTLN